MQFDMSAESPSRSLDKIVIRVPDGMRERIKVFAEANNRSVNAELLALLEKTYPAEATILERVREVADLMKHLPAESRDAVWRNVFGHLETARQEAP